MSYKVTVRYPGLRGGGDMFAGLSLDDARERAAEIVRARADALTDDPEALEEYGYAQAEEALLDADPEHGPVEIGIADGTRIKVDKT